MVPSSTSWGSREAWRRFIAPSAIRSINASFLPASLSKLSLCVSVGAAYGYDTTNMDAGTASQLIAYYKESYAAQHQQQLQQQQQQQYDAAVATAAAAAAAAAAGIDPQQQQLMQEHQYDAPSATAAGQDSMTATGEHVMSEPGVAAAAYEQQYEQ